MPALTWEHAGVFTNITIKLAVTKTKIFEVKPKEINILYRHYNANEESAGEFNGPAM